jgi:type I restriction enzyme S subunit
VPLKELGDWYGGGTPSKSNPAFWTDGDVPWLSPKDMGPEVLHGTQDHVTSEAVSGSSTKLVPAGSVAVVTRSGILERTIPVSIVPFATTMNQDMAVVPRAGIDHAGSPGGYGLLNATYCEIPAKRVPRLPRSEMPRWYGFKLPVPPLEEQRRIVAILEDRSPPRRRRILA